MNNSKKNVNEKNNENLEDFMLLPEKITVTIDIDELYGGNNTIIENKIDLGQNRIEESNSNSKKIFNKTKRSILEERIFKYALEKQKENMIEKQIVWGKEFNGKAFISSPNKIEFKDFIINQSMTITFQLTNISNTFNHFKLLSLNETYKDFFDIVYDKPGRISAGMSCYLKIIFLPKINQDISTFIPFMAKTGPFNIPLICSTRKIIPSILNKTFHFKNTIIGETSEYNCILINDGALDVEYIISCKNNEKSQKNINQNELDEIRQNDNPINDTQFNENQISHDNNVDVSKNSNNKKKYQNEQELVEYLHFKQKTKTKNKIKHKNDTLLNIIYPLEKNILKGYSKTSIKFIFQPKYIGEIKESFFIHFLNKMNQKDTTIEPLKLDLIGKGLPVPIYIENEYINCGYLLYNKLSTTSILLYNRGKIALKCIMKCPKYMKSNITFVPDFGYVQGSMDGEPGKFEIKIKFQVTEELMIKTIEKGYGINDIICIPINVIVPDQNKAVYFILRAHMSSRNLNILPNVVDFGKCYYNETIEKIINIENQSLLPNMYKFNLSLTKDIIINPMENELAPKEMKNIKCIYHPKLLLENNTLHNYNKDIELKNTIYCTSSLEENKKYEIRTTCNVSKSPLILSQNKIKLGMIQENEYIDTFIYINNETINEEDIEIILPDLINDYNIIRLSSYHETIKGKEKKKLDIKFKACNFENLNKINQELLNHPIDSVEICVNNDSNNNRLCNLSIKAKCYIKSKLNDNKNDKNKSPFLSFIIDATISQSMIKVEPAKINFGPIPSGKEQLLSIKIYKTEKEKDKLFDTVFQISDSPFTISNIIQPNVDPLIQIISIHFLSNETNKYKNTLIIKTDSYGDIHVPITAECVKPSLILLPDNGEINFGHVLAGQIKRSWFILQNNGSFDLQFSIKYHNIPIRNHLSHCNVFICEPTEGLIPINDKKIIHVFFIPDHERPIEYKSIMDIYIANRSEKKSIQLQGRCWNNQIYCFADLNANSNIINGYDMMKEAIEDDIFEIPVGSKIPDYLINYISKECVPKIYIIFPKTDKDIKEEAIKQITIGSIPVHIDLLIPKYNGISKEEIDLCLEEGKQIQIVHSKDVHDKIGSNGSFECIMEGKNSHYFNILPNKGNLTPGQEQQINICFNKLTYNNKNKFYLTDFEKNLDIGVYITAKVICNIKGGYIESSLVSSNKSEAIRQTIIFIKAYVSL